MIPARLGSTRLLQKPLRLLGSAPLIVRVWERIRLLDIADDVVVATDAEAVADVVRSAGGNVVMTRADHPSGTDRVAEVSRLPAFSRYQVVVNVQGDEPFVDRAAVVGALSMVTVSGFPVGTVCAKGRESDLRDASVVKVVRAATGRALYFSRAPIPWCRDASDGAIQASLVRRHIGIYAYTRDALQEWVKLPPHPLESCEKLEQLRPLAAAIEIGVAECEDVGVAGIDTEEDLAWANAHWASLNAGRS